MKIETYALQIADQYGDWNTPEEHVVYGSAAPAQSEADLILSGWAQSERPHGIDVPVRVVGIVIL